MIRYLFLGYGSALNSKQEIEMDALIMDGSNLKSGAVAALKTILNPVQVARLVMDKVIFVIMQLNFP